MNDERGKWKGDVKDANVSPSLDSWVTNVDVTHPDGSVEHTSIEEIHASFGMTFTEYRNFVANEPTDANDRSDIRQQRMSSVRSGRARPYEMVTGPHGETVLAPAKFSASVLSDPDWTKRLPEDVRTIRKPEPTIPFRLVTRSLEGIYEKEDVTSTPMPHKYSRAERVERLARVLGTKPLYYRKIDVNLLTWTIEDIAASIASNEDGSFVEYVPQAIAPLLEQKLEPIDTTPPQAIASILGYDATDSGKRITRNIWEKALLDTYFHLYDSEWPEWPRLIPWHDTDNLENLADSLGSEPPWNFLAKSDFIKRHEVGCSVADLEDLIEQFPEQQRDFDKPRVFLGNRSFREILAVAMLLGLPSARIVDDLAMRAALL